MYNNQYNQQTQYAQGNNNMVEPLNVAEYNELAKMDADYKKGIPLGSYHNYYLTLAERFKASNYQVPQQQQNNYIPQPQQQQTYMPQQPQQQYIYASRNNYEPNKSTDPYSVNNAYPTYGNKNSNVTAAPSSSKYSANSEQVKDAIEAAAREAAAQQNSYQVERDPEPVVQQVELQPLEGYEYEPLVTPRDEVAKAVIEGHYIYKVRPKKDEDMDYIKHASIYGNHLATKDYDITHVDPSKIKFSDDISIISDLNTAVAMSKLDSYNNNDEKEFHVAEYLLTTPIVVDKITTDDTYDYFAKIFKSSTSINDLANTLKAKYSNGGLRTKSAILEIDEILTKYFNLVYKNTIGSKWTIKSFMNDMDSISDEIATDDDINKKLYINALIDIYNTLDHDMKSIDLLKDIDDDVAEISETDKAGLAYFVKKLTIATTASEDINFELEEVTRGIVKFVIPTNVPLLSAYLDQVTSRSNNSYSNKIILLINNKGHKFRIMKSKINSYYTIERV